MQNMMAMLQQQYPKELMPQLFEASQGALSDMLSAFPNAPSPDNAHLHCFVTGMHASSPTDVCHRVRSSSLLVAERQRDMHRQVDAGIRVIQDVSDGKACTV